MNDDEKSDRSRLILGGIGAVVLVALIAGAVAGAMRDPLQLEPNSPEGAVQRYVQAVIDRDLEEAAGFMSEDLREECRQELVAAWVPENLTVTLEDVERGEGSATVVLEMRQTQGGVLTGPSEFSFEERFLLEQSDGTWAISEAPWPVQYCQRDGP